MAAPFDTVSAALQTARVRLNDAIQSINGEVLTDTAAFTQVLVIAAWRRLQEALAEAGFSVLDSETVLSTVPACAAADPGIFVYLDWDGYFDGEAPAETPKLPADFISPLDLWERVAAETPGKFRPMDQCLNGLPTVTKGPLNKLWEWRGQVLYLPGATGATDLRIRYAAYLPDFADSGAGESLVHWYSQDIPIARALNALAWYICFEAAKPRGDLDAGAFEDHAREAVQQMVNRETRQGKALYKRAENGKMPDRYTPGRGGQA